MSSAHGSLETADDAELVARVSEGDVAAYRELVRRHGTRLHHYARSVLREPTEAEDVVQETFLRLWQHAASYSPRARVTTWLHRIAHNLAVDRLRSRGRWQPLDDEEEPPVSPRQARELDEQRRVETLEAALAELPERQRAALVLVHLHELSGAEAADVMGTSEDALESLLARGRRALKIRLLARTPKWRQSGGAGVRGTS